VDLCELRYQQLEDRMDRVEKRLDSVISDMASLKLSNDRQFNEIKAMLSSAKDEKFKTMVTVAGTVVAALLGMLGYLITHIK
jgi:phosphoribosylcarboxyaminoimidazole (NCAIR) mutase